MAEETRSDQERRRFIRLDLSEEVRALDGEGRPIGRVEQVGAGGMQIRISPDSPRQHFETGSRLQLRILEPGNIEQTFDVEVRDCAADILGVRFLN